jgi:two-component system, cell cycle response regulator
MATPQAFNLLLRTKSLPKPSSFVLDLTYHCFNRQAPPEILERIIADNPQMTADLLRYAKSPLGGITNPAGSITQTLFTLGSKNTASLALIFSLLSQYRHGKCPHFDYQRFWQKSLARGAAARALAIQGQHDAHKLFVYGVLSCIGELALATAFPEEYGDLLLENLPPDKATQKEKRLFGLSANDLTCSLLTTWHLPESFIKALRAPSDTAGSQAVSGSTLKIRKIMILANHIARICLFELPLADTFLAVEQMAEEQAIPVEQFAPFFDRLVTLWQLASEFFEVPTLHCPNYHEIKTMDDAAMTAAQGKMGPLTILAADDDPVTLFCLQKMLNADHRVVLLAKDGEQALELALEYRPQLLITDWRMPKRSGIDLCKILRKTSVTQQIYIIMLTGNESDDQLVQAFDAGADDYIIKPFTTKVLQARISSAERLIRSQQTISQDREVIKRYAEKLASANRKLQNMAMTDFLTGLPNRRSALQRLQNLVAEVRRYGEPLSCLMLHIDHFKNINDTYGHDCGDTVLRQIARLLEEKARSYDMVSRWGGEEFLIISARSGAVDTRQLAERLRKAVENHTIPLSDDLKIRLTISIGVATWSPDFQNEGQLITVADQALYLAKTNGRNRVEQGDTIPSTASVPD